jgi:hypothetical protein
MLPDANIAPQDIAPIKELDWALTLIPTPSTPPIGAVSQQQQHPDEE